MCLGVAPRGLRRWPKHWQRRSHHSERHSPDMDTAAKRTSLSRPRHGYFWAPLIDVQLPHHLGALPEDLLALTRALQVRPPAAALPFPPATWQEPLRPSPPPAPRAPRPRAAPGARAVPRRRRSAGAAPRRRRRRTPC